MNKKQLLDIMFSESSGLTKTQLKNDFNWFLDNADSIFDELVQKAIFCFNGEITDCDYIIYKHNTIKYGVPICDCDICQRLECYHKNKCFGDN